MTTLLIDGDLFLYRASTAVEESRDFGDGYWLNYSDVNRAKEVVTEQMKYLLREYPGADMIFCLSDSLNFRKELSPTYKAARKPIRKPLCYYPLRDWAKEAWTFVEYPKLEADDVMGILATGMYAASPADDKTIIVSQDKDMMSIPSTIFKNGEEFTVTEEEADLFHMTQTLTGDPTDGYGGCPGVGPAKASKLLTGAADMWRVVVSAYTKAGLTEADALLNARLARILRASDWDAQKQEVKLWTPS